MSEFGVTNKDQISEPPKPLSAGTRFEWLKKPVWLGLSIPWLSGCGLLLVLVMWFLFAPDPGPSDDGFSDHMDMQPQQITKQTPDLALNAFGQETEQKIGQFQNDTSLLVDPIRSYAEANRAGIEKLSDTVRVQSAKLKDQASNIAELQNQLVDVQAKLALLSQTKPRVKSTNTNRSRATPEVLPKSPLTDMRINSIQSDMAWVYWQQQTWAVQAGDTLGSIKITGIDSAKRQVHTSAGILK
ncbi:conjugal transfer protein TraP [Pseudomonas fulva]|uniref:conjugal transfer protein TraP n=1 Tax=Pseudomonas fulva TaxID=47880 RepID=UPI002DB5B0B1|nr:conjugal transfer protein TraP [Pseudomonas fulva]MEB8059272.1 conjugal transfer protein TraP [Pseudomonas fulva]